MRSWLGFPCFGLWAAVPAAVAAAFGCVPSGQRALLDADMLELIDRSTCLVEPVSVGVLCSIYSAVLADSTSGTSDTTAWSSVHGRCSRSTVECTLQQRGLLSEPSLFLVFGTLPQRGS